MIRLTGEPFADVLADLRGLIDGRRVLVVGSGPTVAADLMVRRPSDVVIAVNGGISAVTDPVDVLCINGRTYGQTELDPDQWPDDRRKLHETMLAQSAGRHVGHLVLLMRSRGEQTTDRLAAHGTTWDTVTQLGAMPRTHIVRKASGLGLNEAFCVSSGFNALCIALFCGAAYVVPCGIGTTPGHAYPTPGAGRLVEHRRHLTYDRDAMAAVYAKHQSRVGRTDFQ